MAARQLKDAEMAADSVEGFVVGCLWGGQGAGRNRAWYSPAFEM